MATSQFYPAPPARAPEDALDALVAASPHLARLDGYPDLKVILDVTFDPATHVSVICGGGSGHEPFAAGYVGPGCLAAAVAGPTFASPPASAVRAAIEAVTSPARGCVLLVMNYTGDRLQFGAAVEGARAAGLPVEVVTMGDDVALLPPGSGDDEGEPAYARARAGARGIAGNMLVLKVAGAAAAAGHDLATVAALARAAAARVASMGVATCPCAMPGADRPARLEAGMMELGMGLHGEPGAAVVPLAGGAAGAVRAVVAALLDRGPVAAAVRAAAAAGRPPPPMACLVNSLGGSAVLELGSVSAAALAELCGVRGLPLARLYCGVFASSLDMRGFSISLLLLEGGEGGGGGGGGGGSGATPLPPLLPFLDAPVDVGGAPWPASPAVVDAKKAPVPLPAGAAGPQSPRSTGPPPDEPGVAAFTSALAAAAASIAAVAPRLDALDARAGDGDCGATLAAGAAALEAALRGGALDLTSPRSAMSSVGASLAGMGGTSGGLYALFLAGAAGALPSTGWASAGPAAWAAALGAGAAAIGSHAGAGPGDRTMLDALLPAAEAAVAAVEGKAGDSARSVAAAAAAAAAEGADATAAMVGGAGRAAYVPDEAVLGEPDPGAVAVAAWLGGVAGALC